MPAVNYLSGSTAYSTLTAFSNTWNLTSTTNGSGPTYDGTQELLIANGAFRTSDTNYAKDYNTNKYVTGGTVNTMTGPNYSSLGSGYRYVSFAYRINSLSANSNNINFELNGGNLNIVNSLLYADSGGANQILVYFRFEDVSNPTSFISGGLNSYWVSANDNALASGAVGSANYYTIPGSKIPYYSGTIAFTPTTGTSLTSVTIRAQTPYLLSTANPNITNVCCYLRIGLPMNVTGVNLSSVRTYLST